MRPVAPSRSVTPPASSETKTVSVDLSGCEHAASSSAALVAIFAQPIRPRNERAGGRFNGWEFDAKVHKIPGATRARAGQDHDHVCNPTRLMQLTPRARTPPPNVRECS